MSTYWGIVGGAMQSIRENQTANGQPAIRKGTLPFTPDDSATDITSRDSFRMDFRFVVDQGLGKFGAIYPGSYIDDYNATRPGSGVPGLVDSLASQKAYPNIWVYADNLGKSIYSTILIDLGQNSTSPNILTNATALQLYTALFPNPPFISHANARAGPATEDYNTLKDTTGPLGTTPSVISTEYLCQVPQRKTAGDLFISVLVADLVLLQTLWQLFKLGTSYIFLRKIPNSQHCEGCVAKAGSTL